MMLYAQQITHCILEILHHTFNECHLSRNKQGYLKSQYCGFLRKHLVTKDDLHFVQLGAQNIHVYRLARHLYSFCSYWRWVHAFEQGYSTMF